MHPIIGFVGPSGAGKTTLMMELLRRMPERVGLVRSITTRPSRGPEDDMVFDRGARNDINRLRAEGHLFQISEYAGNVYANDRRSVDALLKNKIGMMAIVEQGVLNFRSAGYDVRIVRIVPRDNPAQTDQRRANADAERAHSGLSADLEVVNSFKPGGLEEALHQLTDFITTLQE